MSSHAPELRILDGRSGQEGAQRNLRLFFVLSGEASITRDGRDMRLTEGSYLAVNGGELCRAEALLPDGLLGVLAYPAEYAEPYLKTGHFRVRASSAGDAPEVREKVQTLLKRIFGWYEQRKEDESMLIEAYSAELLYVLKKECLVRQQDTIVERRRDNSSVRKEILDYLHLHYMEQVSLRDLAKLTYFTETYLSRYIRKQFGTTYSALLTRIRLEHALRAVVQSEETMIRIAMENGFPSAVSFTREFRKHYGLTPSAYRQKRRESGNAAEDEAPFREERRELREHIRDYMLSRGASLRGAKESGQTLRAVSGRNRLLRRFWNDMINVGFARDLLRADVQSHMTEIREGLGIRYVRFWDIWSPELMLYDGNPEHGYSFTRLDAVIAYLYNHQMFPHIEMGFKPVQLSGHVGSSIVFEDRKLAFDSPDAFCAFLERFLRHYMRLYGEDYVGQWRIELWMDPRWETVEDYLSVFEKCRGKAKALLPYIEIGGAGLSREFENIFEALLARWGKTYALPDFLSVYMYPFDNGFLDPAAGGGPTCYRGDDYVRHFLRKVRETARESGLGRVKLYVTEWNSTFANRDPLNDSIYKGAYVVRSLIDMIGLADSVGYWFATDLYSSYYDSDHLLDGSAGLLSKDGICKPAYYGFDFFNRLGNFFLAADEYGLVTSDGNGRYRIVCHNYVHPGDAYFDYYGDAPGDEPPVREAFFAGVERKLRFAIEEVPPGTYIIKTRVLSAEHGSVEDEWRRMGCSDALDRRDVAYLRRICVPQIRIVTMEVTSGVLETELTLPPNGIGSIHIFPAHGT